MGRICLSPPDNGSVERDLLLARPELKAGRCLLRIGVRLFCDEKTAWAHRQQLAA
jgi:hypothetical protein